MHKRTASFFHYVPVEKSFSNTERGTLPVSFLKSINFNNHLIIHWDLFLYMKHND